MRHVAFVLALALTPSAGFAQTYSLIVSPDDTFALQNGVVPRALGFVDDQESIITTPSASYEAQPFRTFTTINCMHGDGDLDSQLADTDRYGDLNCLMIRRRPPHAETGPFEPGTLWMSHSFNTAGAVATSTGVQSLMDGDVYRSRNGTVEFFVRETDLAPAVPYPLADFDIDGMVQDVNGDLYFSLWVSEGPYFDGDLFFIPQSAITYDSNGFVASVTPGSAVVFATEADFSAMVANSGAVSQTGAVLTSVGDLGAIDLDPNGGFWTSTNPYYPNLVAPNFVFGSNFTSRFDNLWTTANGGQLATINGVTMGYTSGLADGTVLGVGVATGQDGVNALVIVPEQHFWITMDAPNSGLPVAGAFDIEIGRCVPNTPVAVLMSIWNNDMPGGWVIGTPLPIIGFTGNPLLELDIPTLVTAGNLVADANGYASLSFTDPGGVPPGTELLIQVVGTPFGSSSPLSLSATSNITFP